MALFTGQGFLLVSVNNSSASSPAKERVDYDLFISYSRRDKDFVRQL
jgi:hypothetical protein